MKHSLVTAGRQSWAGIEALHLDDAQAHWQTCTASGLVCPLDVFEQLFHDHRGDREFARDLMSVDWSHVVWEERLLSGVGLRRVAAPRGYQYAVDEARARTLAHGLSDERDEVQASWRDARTWVRAPVLIEGEVVGMSLGLEVLVGFTRLGDLLGMLDRGEVREVQGHKIWVGVLRP
jgi:hypothetical protein